MKFNGALQLGVGMATGQVALYDIRTNKPYYIKDHMYGLPIKDVEFHQQMDLIYSMDGSTLKIWHKNTVFESNKIWEKNKLIIEVLGKIIHFN